MADIISKDTPSPGISPTQPMQDKGASGGQSEGEASQETQTSSLVELIELFFFAYRDFTQDPDAILKEFGFGRAHHRILHFVNRYPGLRVADLLDILKITKQSLARVLKQLVDEEIIEQRPGQSDRRERRLFTTKRGQKLADRLMEPQLARITKALQLSGSESEHIARQFLYNMIDPLEHEAVMELFSRSSSKG